MLLTPRLEEFAHFGIVATVVLEMLLLGSVGEG
jgi:hypothetical protein